MPCVNNGFSVPASLMCTYPQGYKRVEILCHGTGATSSVTPIWVTFWYNSSASTGDLLQVPYETEQPFVYNEPNDKWVGLIPNEYDWTRFELVKFDAVSPKFSCVLNVYDRFDQLIFTNTTSNTCAEYKVGGCALDRWLRPRY
jgi:hypothetical protein